MAAPARAALLPTLFLSHGGGPCFFMTGGAFAELDSASPAASFLRRLEPALALPSRPAALVVVSAHWEGPGDAVLLQSSPAPPLLFDYAGFPPETYALTWPARGAPALAARAAGLLRAAGFATALDAARGYDHGVFVPLKLAFPAADVPTLQVSLHGALDPARHVALGRALAPLRAEGALIIGSGFATHNLREIVPGAPPAPWALAFDGWLARTLLGGSSGSSSSSSSSSSSDTAAAAAAAAAAAPQSFAALSAALIGAPAAAPHFARAHPRTEHLLPLYVALGAACPGGGAAPADALRVTQLYSQIVMGSASLASYRFD
jgi:aromatic ring-opening dioxygenase catalytic subunit (LigB family)